MRFMLGERAYSALFLYNELLRMYKKGVHTSQSITKAKGAPNFEYIKTELQYGTK